MMENTRCTKGLWDSSVPNLELDSSGISNYYWMYKKLEQEFPKGQRGKILISKLGRYIVLVKIKIMIALSV